VAGTNSADLNQSIAVLNVDAPFACWARCAYAMVQLSPSSICCGPSSTSIDFRLCLPEDSIDCKATWLVSLENSAEPAFPDVQLTCDATAGQKVVEMRYAALWLLSSLSWRLSLQAVAEPAQDHSAACFIHFG
jgi:hypothetical protein